jgi:uncharacterized protein
LFSAARTEFKHLEHYYFHNCPYERLWQDAGRRHVERTPTMEVLHRLNQGWKLILVGDATMAPYEIVEPGGSVEHMNAEPGEAWLRRLVLTFPKAAWLNPVPERYWQGTQSIEMMRALMEGRMFPLTLGGIDRAMRNLQR